MDMAEAYRIQDERSVQVETMSKELKSCHQKYK